MLIISALAAQMAFAPALLGYGDASAESIDFIRTAVGNPQDGTDALRAKAERGDPEAEYKLALAYDAGVGAPQDLEQAAAWYQRAAEQGHAAAQYSLGVMYENGRGVKQDSIRAHMWLNLAAAASQAGAQSERDLVAKSMTRAQIAEAVRQARAWESRPPSSDTSPPAPGTEERNGPR
jgi:uncharacterized protein